MIKNRTLLSMGLVASAATLAGCSFIHKTMAGAREFVMGPEADVSRVVPAGEDLPTTSTIAIASFDGNAEDTAAMAGLLGQLLTGSGRFQVVERERLSSIIAERGCAASDLQCVSGALPASALVLGTVPAPHCQESVSSLTVKCPDKKNPMRMCTTFTRSGTVDVSANLRLVESATGRVLFQRMISRHKSDSSTMVDGTPSALDNARMTSEARKEIAEEFFAAVSPHEAIETIELESDRDLPELKQGNECFKEGRYADALRAYELALVRAKSAPEVDDSERAKVFYSLGVAHGVQSNYDLAVENLEAALKLDRDDDWSSMLLRVQQWRADAEKVARQLAYGQPTVELAPQQVTAAAEP